jgi:hypothetical protein
MGTSGLRQPVWRWGNWVPPVALSSSVTVEAAHVASPWRPRCVPMPGQAVDPRWRVVRPFPSSVPAPERVVGWATALPRACRRPVKPLTGSSRSWQAGVSRHASPQSGTGADRQRISRGATDCPRREPGKKGAACAAAGRRDHAPSLITGSACEGGGPVSAPSPAAIRGTGR